MKEICGRSVDLFGARQAVMTGDLARLGAYAQLVVFGGFAVIFNSITHLTFLREGSYHLSSGLDKAAEDHGPAATCPERQVMKRDLVSTVDGLSTGAVVRRGLI